MEITGLPYEKKPRSENLNHRRKGFNNAGNPTCIECFKKNLLIDELRAEASKLRAKLAYDVKKTGRLPNGPHVPSSKIDLKPNSKADLRKKIGGAKKGHKGHGRKSVHEGVADECSTLDLSESDFCDCGGKLHCLGSRERSVIEAAPIKAKQILFTLQRYRCLKCRRITEKKPSVLPKCLYGNRLLSQAAVMHYFHGVTIGKLLDMFGPNVTEGGLIQAFHRLGKFCAQANANLIDDFRSAPVRHADETGWRNDGHSGYAWLFTCENTSILEFANSRAASVAHKIIGAEPLSGTLVVDRYAAYNKMPVTLQYCYAHLLREVEKLDEEFPDNEEVSLFTAKLIPLLSLAMKLRGLDISDRKFYQRAKDLKKDIIAVMHLDCRHLGIERIQRIFLENANRLYQWVKDRRVPADNNKAERELRPTVIARKVSFGSQSDAGAKTRGSIMTVLFTARKRLAGRQALEDWLHNALDQLAQNKEVKFHELLPTMSVIKSHR